MATGGNGLRERAAPMAAYANYFKIGYNAAEFLIGVGQVEPQSGERRFALTCGSARRSAWGMSAASARMRCE